MTTVQNQIKQQKPKEKLYFEQLKLGQRYQFGNYKMTEEGIIKFALEFDPQYFHTDLEQAKKSPFGSLIASGCHTLAIKTKLLVEHLFSTWHVIAGKEISSCKFLQPVYPDDILSVNIEITNLSAHKKKHFGYVILNFVVKNDKNISVMSGDLNVVLKSKITTPQ